ncbi:hypothetical protein Tco_0905083 [Tanacetum coccineum]
MEYSSSNSEERELQQMQLKEKYLHSKYMAWFKELNSHLETLYTTGLQWAETKDHMKLHFEYSSKKSISLLQRSYFSNKCWQKHFKDYMGCEPETYRRNLLWYLDDLDKLIDERQQESLVTEGTTLEANLSTDGTSLDAISVTEAMDDNLVAKESTNDSVTSSEQLDESSSSSIDADVEKILVDTVASDIENAAIEPSYDSDTVSEVHHDTFENVFANEIQSHEQRDPISDTYMVNDNNSDIIFDIPYMDPDRVQNGQILSNKSDEAKIKFDTEDLETINIELEYSTKSSNVSQNEAENLKSQLSEFADKKFDKVFQKIESMNKKKFDSRISNDFLHKSLYDSDPSNVESESGEKKILFRNETSSFETKIKELEMTLAQQTKDFEDVKVDFSKKTDKFETYFEKLKNARVVLERQLDHKIQDSKAKKDQFLKQIASLVGITRSYFKSKIIYRVENII